MTDKKSGAIFRYDPTGPPPPWAVRDAPPPRVHLSLEDRAQLQAAQKKAQSSSPARVRAPQAKPVKSGDDQVLNNKYVAVLVLLLLPVMVAVLWWFVHISPSH